MNWPDAALKAIEAGEQSALVTIARAAGSTPREAGTKMLVLTNRIEGSIGGGQLEFQAIDAARALMAVGQGARRLVRQILGPDLGQCCGGAVSLLIEALDVRDRDWLFEARKRSGQNGESWLLTPEAGPKNWLDEAAAQAIGWSPKDRAGLLPGAKGWRVIERIAAERTAIFLFGAGHVGRALANVLAELPFALTWVDSRSDAFPERLPAGVVARRTMRAAEEVDTAGPGTFFLVMTHSHDLDFEICERILRRDDFGFLGLIGSATKRARFAHRLRDQGIKPELLERLICPIGLDQVPGKQPMAIAVGVAGQMLALRERRQRDRAGAKSGTEDRRGTGVA